jgi:hypothetical protein
MTEDAIHRSIFRFLRSVLPAHWLVYHTPNGGSRNKIEAANMKGLGVLAGVPDLTIVGDGKAYFLEVKAKSGRVQPSQHAFMDKLEANKIAHAVVRSIDDVRAFIEQYGLPSREVRS